MPQLGDMIDRITDELETGPSVDDTHIQFYINRAIHEYEAERFWFNENREQTFEAEEGVTDYAADPYLPYIVNADYLTIRKKGQYRIYDPSLDQENYIFTVSGAPTVGQSLTVYYENDVETEGSVAFRVPPADIANYQLYLFDPTGPTTGLFYRLQVQGAGGSIGGTGNYSITGELIEAGTGTYTGQLLHFAWVPNGEPLQKFSEREQRICSVSSDAIDCMIMDAQETDEELPVSAPQYWAKFGNLFRLFPAPDDYYQVRAVGHIVYPELRDVADENVWTNEGFELIKARAKYEICRNVTMDDQMAQRCLEDEQRIADRMRRDRTRRTSRNQIKPFSV